MKAVILDVDGVLVDSEYYWDRSRRAILREAGVPDSFDDLEVRGMNIDDQYDYLSERFELEVEREGFVGLYDRRAEKVYYQKAELLSCFEEIQELVREEELKFGLVSASPRRWIEMVLDRFGLEEKFDIVVTANDIDGPSKPDPAIYLHAAEELGVEPENCVAVEDSENGLRSASEAGMKTVGFRHSELQDLRDADEVVDSEEDVYEAVRELV
ncbi:MAG: HAD family hydrolase [Candidatus Nanohaloarchaea archaeon]